VLAIDVGTFRTGQRRQVIELRGTAPWRVHVTEAHPAENARWKANDWPCEMTRQPSVETGDGIDQLCREGRLEQLALLRQRLHARDAMH
jgi:hypothetical protein